MVECKMTGRVTCLVERMPCATGEMAAKYYVKVPNERRRAPDYVQVIARGKLAYWALENVKPGMTLRIKGVCRAMLSTLVVEQTQGRIIDNG